MEHVDSAASSPAGSNASRRLYPRLLGAAWDDLSPVVQRVHTAGGLTHAEGSFQVSRAPGRLLGLVLDAARVPRASDRAHVRLTIQARGETECWLRSFDGRPLTTRQSRTPDGLLAERIGMLEFRFHLLARGGDLLFRQQSVAACLGSWQLLLPHWLAPRLAAREGPAGAQDQTRVEVRVMAPGGSLLFSYRGTVRWGA